jgi:glycine betaine/choline ABC-type transport system substrate-binding protein
MDSTLMCAAVVGREVNVISAFSADGHSDAYRLQVLTDTCEAVPPAFVVWLT